MPVTKVPKKPSAKDVPGTGLASRAGKAIETRKARNSSALAEANKAIGRMRNGQTTDSQNR